MIDAILRYFGYKPNDDGLMTLTQWWDICNLLEIPCNSNGKTVIKAIKRLKWEANAAKNEDF